MISLQWIGNRGSLAHRRFAFAVQGMAILAAACATGVLATAQGPPIEEQELLAQVRLFPDAGPDVRAIRRSAAGLYYILSGPGAVVEIYSAAGKRIGQISAAAPESKEAAGAYGQDLDIDAAGRIYIADSGAAAVDILAADGHETGRIGVATPTSVAALADGEVAVASVQSNHLVEIFDAHGETIRDIGALFDLAERSRLNRFLNAGRLLADFHGHVYYAFSYVPEPTVREYDLLGHVSLEFSATAIEYLPRAQAARREIARQDDGAGTPTLKPVIDGFGVDPESNDIWMAFGDQLVRFDRDGNRRATYRTYTKEGGRVVPVCILVEPDRLILATNASGIYAFGRPDHPPPATPSKMEHESPAP
jgi:sugar lactone lactonase YvrE